MSSASAASSGATIRAHLLRWLVARSLRRRRPTPQSRDSSPPRIWTLLVAPLRALTINAHLLRWLVARSLRRRRPTPQSRDSSPPRIWTLLVAPLRALTINADLLRSRGAAAATFVAALPPA